MERGLLLEHSISLAVHPHKYFNIRIEIHCRCLENSIIVGHHVPSRVCCHSQQKIGSELSCIISDDMRQSDVEGKRLGVLHSNVEHIIKVYVITPQHSQLRIAGLATCILLEGEKGSSKLTWYMGKGGL